MKRSVMATIVAGLATSLDPGAQAAACPSDTVSMDVTSIGDLEGFIDAMDCTGRGVYDVTWHGRLQIWQAIEVSDEKNVTVTGYIGTSSTGSMGDSFSSLGSTNDAYAVVDGGNTTGLFRVSNGSTLSIKHLALEGGSSSSGGAIAVTLSSSLYVRDSTLKYNMADSGGGIYASHSSVDVHGSSTFTNNYARHGGAVYAWKSNISIGGNTSFSRNTVEGSFDWSTSSGLIFYNSSGGAIHAEDSTMHMDGDLSFADNSADYGGAMYGYSSNMSMKGNVTFANNHAEEFGGHTSATSGNHLNCSTTTGHGFARNKVSRYNAGELLSHFQRPVQQTTDPQCS